MTARRLNTASRSGRGFGALPMAEPEKNSAPAAATAAIHRTAEGPSVVFRSNRTPKQPEAAPSRSTPYTRPIGNGLRVNARLTTTPEKKNGTAMHSASPAQIAIAVMERTTTGANVICTIRLRPMATANAVL